MLALQHRDKLCTCKHERSCHAGRLCASGMPDDAKVAIKELVKHLGGKYTQKMSRHNTHLIIQKAMGDKWKHTTVFRVIPVTPDWLVDSARAGKLYP